MARDRWAAAGGALMLAFLIAVVYALLGLAVPWEQGP